MWMKNRKLVVLLACAVIGVTSGVVASAVFGSSSKRAISPAAVRAALAKGERVKVASFASVPGLADRSVFLQRNAGGLVCLWDARDAADQGGGGCNDASDPFNGKKMMFSLGWDGGPALSTVSDGRLSGIVAQEVDRAYVEMSDGSRRDLKLTNASPYRAFAYRFKQKDVRAQLEPVAVVALDASGREIDRQATGFK